jgi:hypothetical protein
VTDLQFYIVVGIVVGFCVGYLDQDGPTMGKKGGRNMNCKDKCHNVETSHNYLMVAQSVSTSVLVCTKCGAPIYVQNQQDTSAPVTNQ